MYRGIIDRSQKYNYTKAGMHFSGNLPSYYTYNKKQISESELSSVLCFNPTIYKTTGDNNILFSYTVRPDICFKYVSWSELISKNFCHPFIKGIKEKEELVAILQAPMRSLGT